MSFADIAATTDRRAETFSFTETERKKIINATQPLPATATHSATEVVRKLEQLKRRETAWALHLASLAEYAKAHRIPRGLRITLQPALFRDNSEFLQKWRGILNRCSLDLITLTIQQLQTGTRELKQQIHTSEEECKVILDTDNTPLKELEAKIEKLQQEILQVKLRKFTRDTRDYERGEVYTWQDTRRKTRYYRRQTAPFADTSSGGSSDDGLVSPVTSQQQPPVPFLGEGSARHGGKPGGGRGNQSSTRRGKHKGQFHR
ncbi:uncharacterized protein LOC121398378 [Xenopus laevis]|uniref:Uncharacterized protein LOC121398378 n=1 Tax=Xenopus laevis TaxID=8355 RepID=A0A8J1LVF9_XENLA|nr:uncharacterized protein LOC121398378 [Xenopus laevis]